MCIRDRFGIICGSIWESFPVWGSFAVGDHLRRCTELAGLYMREKPMHDLLVSKVINYSLVGIPERKACIWGQINVLIWHKAKARLRCRLSFEKKYCNPSIWFEKRLRFFLFIFNLSPRKRSCENTLTVPNMQNEQTPSAFGRRMKTNR